MADTAAGSTIVDTSPGKVDYAEHGDGAPLLFVHGSPGGRDQGAVTTKFLHRKDSANLDLLGPGSRNTAQ